MGATEGLGTGWGGGWMSHLSVRRGLLAVVQWAAWGPESREEALSSGRTMARFQMGKRVQGKRELRVGCGA